jgi:hypothetical protein
MIDEKIINEIVAACNRDTRLIVIIRDVLNMTKKGRNELREKASKLLYSSNSTDKEALKFYYLVTEDGVAEEIARRLVDNG